MHEGWRVWGSTAPSSPVSQDALACRSCPQNSSSPESQAVCHSQLITAVHELQTSLPHLGRRKILGLRPHPGLMPPCSATLGQCLHFSGHCIQLLVTLHSRAASSTCSPTAWEPHPPRRAWACLEPGLRGAEAHTSSAAWGKSWPEGRDPGPGLVTCVPSGAALVLVPDGVIRGLD